MNPEQHAYIIFTKSRYDRLRFDDGSAQLYLPGEGQRARNNLNRPVRLSYEEWAAAQPRYWSAAHRAEQWELHRNTVDSTDEDPAPLPVGEVEQVRGWRGYFYDANESRQLTDLIEVWSGGVPAAEIAQALDVVSTMGWQVVSVTEDKGLYAGIDAQREAGPVTVRMLLRRPTS